jgi:TubC N-terminal docking domain
MTLDELLNELRCRHVKMTLGDDDTLYLEPRDSITEELRAALAEHHAALITLLRDVPAAPPVSDALLAAFDELDAHTPATTLEARLRGLAAGLRGSRALAVQYPSGPGGTGPLGASAPSGSWRSWPSSGGQKTLIRCMSVSARSRCRSFGPTL